MAQNYANLFFDKFENEMLDENEKETMRYIDEIFFIWHHDEKSLKHFINFCDNFSKSRKMKSNIKFETNMSSESVNFLDVQVSTKENKIKTSLYSKLTDSHLYLNTKIMPSTPRYEKIYLKGSSYGSEESVRKKL